MGHASLRAALIYQHRTADRDYTHCGRTGCNLRPDRGYEPVIGHAARFRALERAVGPSAHGL